MINTNMLEQFITPETLSLIEFIGSMILGFWIKDLAINLVTGFMFWRNRSFNLGDEVYIDNAKAIIVKIGIRQTVFQIEDDRGITWRYVWNDRIKYAKLEKVVRKEDE